jgi:predicted GNAT family acetyltransferase
MTNVNVEPVDSENLEEVRAYLAAHEETCQFLLNNLASYGYKLTEHPNSGNYRLLRGPRGVEGVFCLARRGNLLAQTNADYAEAILRSCSEEPVALRGFIGDWKSIEPVLLAHKKRDPSYRPSYESKEILYSLPLAAGTGGLRHDARVRLLGAQDFSPWSAFSAAYMAELNLPDDLDENQKRRGFEEQAAQKLWWGLFLDGELTSRAALNSSGERVGQVGGVFTPKPRRKKGYGKATMLHMLKDCREMHGHEKSLLFTGEADVPAQKLYESIGYRRAGSFALILG